MDLEVVPHPEIIIHIDNDMNINIHIDVNMNIDITPPTLTLCSPPGPLRAAPAWNGGRGISIFILITT